MIAVLRFIPPRLSLLRWVLAAAVAAAGSIGDATAADLPLATPAASLGLGASNQRGLDINEAGTVVSRYVPTSPNSWWCDNGWKFTPPHPDGGRPIECANGCFHEFYQARAINDAGTAVGYKGSFGTNTCPVYFAGYEFGPGGGLLPGSDVFNLTSQDAFDINESGRIIGEAYVGGTIGYVTWPDSASWAEPLPKPPGNAAPNAINDAGVIVGGGQTSGAIVWADDGGGYDWAYLGKLPGDGTSEAVDVNGDGVAVGWSGNSVAAGRAVLWRPTPSGFTVEALPIPYPGGACHEATGISDSGWIVGNCTPAGGERVGVAWQLNGASVEFVGSLVPLDGDTRSNAQAVNDSGLATGSSGVGPETAVVWQIGGTTSSVPVLGPVWSLAAALLAAGIVRLRLDAPARTGALDPRLGRG